MAFTEWHDSKRDGRFFPGTGGGGVLGGGFAPIFITTLSACLEFNARTV